MGGLRHLSPLRMVRDQVTSCFTLTACMICQSDAIAIAGLVVAVVAIVVGAVAARRWGTRRGRIEFDCVSSALIPDSHLAKPGGLHKVTYNGIEVGRSHLVQVSIRNVGPHDIASSSFDSGVPLKVQLNCKICGTTSVSHPDLLVSTEGGPKGVIRLGSGLLSRREKWTVGLLVEGQADAKLLNKLVETDITDLPYERSLPPVP
jgi:hypothetical protein